MYDIGDRVDYSGQGTPGTISEVAGESFFRVKWDDGTDDEGAWYPEDELTPWVDRHIVRPICYGEEEWEAMRPKREALRKELGLPC